MKPPAHTRRRSQSRGRSAAASGNKRSATWDTPGRAAAARSPRRCWSPSEVALLRRSYPNTLTKLLAQRLRRPLTLVYQKAIKLGLRKSAAYMASPAACRLRRGDNVGKPLRFRPGHTPFNKGIKGWDAGGRSHATRFPKGHRPHTWAPVGTEVLDSDGYRKRKISNRKVASRFNWKYVHVLLWERRHGRLPKGHAVIFVDGDKTNIRLGNLRCVSRGELMRHNSVHRLPKALVEVIHLRGAVVRQIRRRTA